MARPPEVKTARMLPDVDKTGWITLTFIMCIALILRGFRLDELPGGFLVFNEIFYINAATTQLNLSLLDRFLNPGLYDKPPLYTNVIALLYSLKLPLVAGARAVSVMAGTATVFITFLVARQLYDQRTALASAAALAVMPGVVLVDHNIQVDSLFVTLFMSSIYLYLVSIGTGRQRYAACSGVLLGLSILTKQPAVLVLPALAFWEIWRSRGIEQLKSGRFGVFAVSSLTIGLSWYLIQLMIDPARLMAGMQATGGRAAMSAKGLDFWVNGIPVELAWMVFPAAAVVISAGLLLQARDRSDGDKLTIVSLMVFLLYYVQYHFHTYYLLPMAPFLAIAFGRACMGVAGRWPSSCLRAAVVSIVIACMLFGSLIMLAGHKWGRWSPLTAGSQPGFIPGTTRLFVDPPVIGFLGPFTGLLAPALKAVSLDMSLYIQQSPDGEDNSLILTSGPDKDYPVKIPAVHVCEDTRYRPVLFGYAIGQWHEVPQQTYMFANADWTAEKVGPLWRFGYLVDTLPSKWTLYDRKTLRDIFLIQ